MDKLKKMTV